MKSHLTILGSGTSTGVPVPGCRCAVCAGRKERNLRTRTSAYVQFGGCHFIIDTSSDFRAQVLREEVPRIDAILFTHYHADHVLGLDDVRGYNYVQNEAIPCYGTLETFTELKKVFHYVFFPDPRYKGGGIPRLILNQIEGLGPLQIGETTIETFPLHHGGTTVTGFRFGDLAYVTDCKTIPPASMEKLQGLKYLILDGLRFEAHNAHLTIPEAVAVAQELRVEKTYLIHMTHSVDYYSVNHTLPPGIELAYDGLKIEW